MFQVSTWIEEGRAEVAGDEDDATGLVGLGGAEDPEEPVSLSPRIA